MGKTLRTVLRREAKEVKQYRFLTKVVSASVTALASVLMLMYTVSVLYGHYGAFTVSVLKFDSVKYAVALCDDPSFLEPTSYLDCDASKDITNIAEASLPMDLDAINGQHNGENYVAYTFYCKNTGTEALNYTYEIFATNITKQLDKAVRVRVYVDGVYENFARTASDGSGPEPNTTPFQTGNTIVKRQISGLAPGDMTRFTVVVWLEGNDPDCVDDKLGGEFKIDMNIDILGGTKKTAV